MSKTLKIYIAVLVLLIVGIAFVDANRPKPIDWSPNYLTYSKKPLGLYVLNEELFNITGNELIQIFETPYEFFTYPNEVYYQDYEEDYGDYSEEYDEYEVEIDTVDSYNSNNDSVDENEIRDVEEDAFEEEMVSIDTISYNENYSEYSNSQDAEVDYNQVLFYVNHRFQMDKKSTESILNFVGEGNTAFISSNGFNEVLMDSLKFSTNYLFDVNDTLELYFSKKSSFKSKYKMEGGFNGVYFSKFDSTKTIVLGHQKHLGDKEEISNFIAIKYKNGIFFLHTQPAAFSNYHFLKANHAQYAAELLSYIPENKTIHWFLKDQSVSEISNSPMRYILSQPALKWAWYFFLIGMFLFMIFNAKRRQRKIPISIPLKNTTVDFTKTIGNLYFQEGSHNVIIEKKIIFFLEKIRTDFYIETDNLNDDFTKKLHLKSGKKLEIIQLIVRLIKKSRKTYQNSEEDLVALNRAIEEFWK
jgi:hypothetical protein